MDTTTAAPSLPDSDWLEVSVEYARHQVRVLARPSFWDSWSTILRFSKSVQKELQDFNFQVDSLLNTVMSKITYNSQPGMRELVEFNTKWLEFTAYYHSRTEPYLFAPLATTLETMDRSFDFLAARAGTDRLTEVIHKSQVPYQNIKIQIGDCPRLIGEIENLAMRMADGLSTSWVAAQVDRSQLLRVLVDRWEDEDVKNACFELKVDYETLKGDTKSARVRELILDRERKEQLPELIRVIHRLRQDLKPALLGIVPEQLLQDKAPGDFISSLRDPRIALLLTTRIQALETTVKSLVIQADSLTQNLLDIILQKKGE